MSRSVLCPVTTYQSSGSVCVGSVSECVTVCLFRQYMSVDTCLCVPLVSVVDGTIGVICGYATEYSSRCTISVCVYGSSVQVRRWTCPHSVCRTLDRTRHGASVTLRGPLRSVDPSVVVGTPRARYGATATSDTGVGPARPTTVGVGGTPSSTVLVSPRPCVYRVTVPPPPFAWYRPIPEVMGTPRVGGGTSVTPGTDVGNGPQ